jgi:hypothetical protein
VNNDDYPTKAEREAARAVLEKCAALGKEILGDWRRAWAGPFEGTMEMRATLTSIDICIDLLKRDPDMRFKALLAENGGKKLT